MRTISDVSTLGIDFGSRRVGIAVSASDSIATAHSVIANPGEIETLAARIIDLAAQLDATTLVLGKPTRVAPTHLTSKIDQLAVILRAQPGHRVVLWDEDLTSVEAEENLRLQGKRRARIRGDIDKEAARLILQSYLDTAGRAS